MAYGPDSMLGSLCLRVLCVCVPLVIVQSNNNKKGTYGNIQLYYGYRLIVTLI